MKSYNVCLIRDEYKTIESALDEEKNPTRHDLNPSNGLSGALFVGAQNRATPEWVEFVNPFLKEPVKDALLANISAVMLVLHENRIFALCFGHGKSLLAASSIVKDFGLKVTLNRVAPDKLRSIDVKTYEDLVVATRTQTSKGARVENFQLDIARNLVRGVTGDSIDTTMYKRLTGADSLHLTTDLGLERLGDLLEELLAAYEDDVYKKHFEWIDNIKEVDTSQKQRLDECLVEAFVQKDTEAMYLAPADVVEWNGIHGFNYTGGPKSIRYAELSLEDYLEVLGEKHGEVTLDQLKRHKVRVRQVDSETFRDLWSIYDCIVWETELDGGKYVLFDGRWFVIDRIYAKRVATFVQSLTSISSSNLPDAKFGQDEGDYNQGVATAKPKDFALLDRENIRPEGAYSRIEPCDLFSIKKQFIHVKKRSSSATLSHLFGQSIRVL